MNPSIEQSLSLRNTIGEQWMRAHDPERLAMFKNALRFSLSTIRMRTKTAEDSFIAGKGPIIHREQKRYRKLLRQAAKLEAVSYMNLYLLMEKSGLCAKASFTLGLLGCDGLLAICPDMWWFRFFNRDIKARGGWRKNTDALRLEIWRKLKDDPVTKSWRLWFENGPNGHQCHIPILQAILKVGEQA